MGSFLDRLQEIMDEQAREQEPDMVNHPPHYTQGGVECIDAIKASMTPEAYRGYLKGNAIKYLWRYEQNGGTEDLHKAGWYLSRLEAECE